MVDKSQIKYISEKPGVYLWKDKNNKVLYVGKAKNLKKELANILIIKCKIRSKLPKCLNVLFLLKP